MTIDSRKIHLLRYYSSEITLKSTSFLADGNPIWVYGSWYLSPPWDRIASIFSSLLFIIPPELTRLTNNFIYLWMYQWWFRFLMTTITYTNWIWFPNLDILRQILFLLNVSNKSKIYRYRKYVGWEERTLFTKTGRSLEPNDTK